MKYVETNDATSLAGSKLILPSANGIAFFGQLAIDLLILNCKATRSGYLASKYVNAMIGPDAFDASSTSLSTAFEVYTTTQSETKYTFVQLRSSVEKTKSKAFAEEFVEWVLKSGFETVIVLTGIDATYLRDFESNRFGFKSEGVHAIETQKLVNQEWSEVVVAKEDDAKVRFLPPGAGVSNVLAAAFGKSKIKNTFLTFHTFDGDNCESAIVFTKKVMGLHGIKYGDIKIPYSWSQLQESTSDVLY